MLRTSVVSGLRVLGSSCTALLFACAAPEDEATRAATTGELAQLVPIACGFQPNASGGVTWTRDCTCGPSFHVCERVVPAVFEQVVAGLALQSIDARVVDASVGADPVMHLYGPNGQEVAVDDNGNGGLLPRIHYKVPVDGDYRVVVHARSAAATGTGHVQINARAPVAATFGGTFVTLTSVAANERLQTTNLPGGEGTHAIYTLAADGLHAKRDTGGGVAGGVSVALGAISSTTIVVGSSQNTYARIVRNDAALAGHDPDGDGLGTALEAELGTCSTKSGSATGADGVAFLCARAVDPADTDGDGLRDGWELLGRADVTPGLPLPAWGANPRHKDMFVEVDYMQTPAAPDDRKLSPQSARVMSAYYGDRQSAPSATSQATHAATLRNPDGRTGITTHLDVGIAPELADDLTVYGDWGGHDLVPQIPDGQGGWKGQDVDAWRTHLAANRVGTFRYALPYVGEGGQSGPGLGWKWAIDEDAIQVHESGHANGLGHSGPATDAIVDTNCKPNYPSVMNYAFQDVAGFSDGGSALLLDNSRVIETAAIPTDQAAVLKRLADRFAYRVDFGTGSVDWNRDGVFAPTGVGVRAYTNNRPQGQCELTRYNGGIVDSSDPDPTHRSTHTPAIVHLPTSPTTTIVFTALPGVLAASRSTSAFACPTPSATACGAFTTTLLPVDSSGGVDAARIATATGDEVVALVVGGADHATLSTIEVRAAGGAIAYGAATVVPHAGLGLGEPSLTALPDGTALATYTNGDHVVFRRLRSVGGALVWGPEVVLSGSLSSIKVKVGTSASTFVAPLVAGGPAQVLVAMVGTDGYLDVRKIDPDTGTAGALLSPIKFAATGRPSGAFVPDPESALGGRIYVAYPNGIGTLDGVQSRNELRQVWSTGESGTAQLTMESAFDNQWTFGAGIDLAFDPGIDTNLRAAWTLDAFAKDDPGRVRFLPKADGIEAYVMRDYDDWQVLRYGVCHALVAPGVGDVGHNPTTCPAAFCAVDQARDYDESDVDCGGDRCAACADGLRCARDADCASGWCNTTGTCVASACGDGKRDNGEFEVDCGGGCGLCPSTCPSGTRDCGGDVCVSGSQVCP